MTAEVLALSPKRTPVAAVGRPALVPPRAALIVVTSRSVGHLAPRRASTTTKNTTTKKPVQRVDDRRRRPCGIRSLLYRTIYLVLGPLQTGADRY